MKYSALATNVTLRERVSGMKSQSAYERWLLARIAGPSAGTFGGPFDLGPEHDPQHGTDGDPLQEPVEHRWLTRLPRSTRTLEA